LFDDRTNRRQEKMLGGGRHVRIEQQGHCPSEPRLDQARGKLAGFDLIQEQSIRDDRAPAMANKQLTLQGSRFDFLD
jgi:hypothetical protein